jgi:hypothetical protein
MLVAVTEKLAETLSGDLGAELRARQAATAAEDWNTRRSRMCVMIEHACRERAATPGAPSYVTLTSEDLGHNYGWPGDTEHIVAHFVARKCRAEWVAQGYYSDGDPRGKALFIAWGAQ